MGHVLDCTQQQRRWLSHTLQSASRERPNGAAWYMTRERAAFHTGLFYASGWFYITSGCEAPVSTFTTIIPFISIKVSITGQRLDQINGPWWWNTVRSYPEKRKETERAKGGRGDSRAMRLQSWLNVGFCSLSKSRKAMMCTCMHKHTHSNMCIPRDTSVFKLHALMKVL